MFYVNIYTQLIKITEYKLLLSDGKYIIIVLEKITKIKF